jgi:hypothetical protein
VRQLTAASIVVLLAAPAQAALTGVPRLSTAYDAILSARFEDAERQLAEACPPAPREACLTLRAVSLWWQIQLNPNDRTLDDRFERAAADAIAAATAWTAREPRRAEAWFYLAGARAPRVQWLVLRGERIAAAREGNRIRQALERALDRDPALADAHFGIGLYHYYADVAPAALKALRWLLLLPGGNREEGLREMLHARARGELLGGEADFQLHYVYLWYEQQPARALELLRDLDVRYPSNPLFLQRIAEIEAEYLRDHAASSATWRALLERAAARTVHAAEIADARARLGLAESLLALSQPARAREVLAPLLAAASGSLHSARAIALLLDGHAHAALGDADRARTAYRAAIAAAPDDDVARVERRARTALGRNF